MKASLSEERKQELQEKVDNFYLRLIGSVSFLLGSIVTIFACWLLYKSFQVSYSSIVTVFIGVAFLIGTFFVCVGRRMLFKKPNRYGSILSPVAWGLLGSMFIALTVIVGLAFQKVSIDSSEFVNTMVSLVSCIAFSVCCFYLAYSGYKKR